MKIDRRSFLSLGLGAAAGTALSPLPWKLTDDLSIWTQMWPWTPVPQDGNASYVNSVCTLCPGGCGITVRKIENRAVKIEGMAGHPVNDGGICVLGLSGLQLLYGPRRIQSPLKKVDGNWVKITWDEAYSLVTEKIVELRDRNAPQSIACISGLQPGTTSQLLERLLMAVGSPNLMSIPSSQDAYELAAARMHGDRCNIGIDVENADFILSFGSGIIDGWGSPVRMIKAHSLWKDKKIKIVQIEPRLSNTAAKAGKWFAINPGAEALLALSIAHVIVRDSLYKNDFIENHTVGFEAWVDEAGNTQKGFKQIILDDYAPETIAGKIGIDKSEIEGLAKAFAAAGHPVALYGRGQGHVPGSLFEAMAVHALNALVCNINQTGGVWAMPKTDDLDWSAIEMDEIAKTGLASLLADKTKKGLSAGSGGLVSKFADLAMTDANPIKLLFIAGANPCHSLPDSKAIRAAVSKIPFIVSFSSYFDETTSYAHVVLPNHVYLERYEDIATPKTMQKPMVSISRPVVPPLYNTRNIGDSIIEIAKKLGEPISASFPWDNYESCLEATLGDKWPALLENGFVVDGDFSPDAWEKAFHTSAGKFDFSAGGLIERHPEIKSEGDDAAYPLLLIPYDVMKLASCYIGDPPFVIKTVEDTVLKGNDSFIEVNPETAERFSIKNGGYAIVTTPKGKAKVRVNYSEGIKPGVIAIPRGLGHNGDDKYLSGKGVNINELIGPIVDPDSGFNAAWGVRANLARS